MDKKKAQIAAARRTKELMEGEGGLKDVLDRVERSYLDAIVGTDVTDTATREALYHRTMALRDIKSMMVALISRGAGAETIVRRLSDIRKTAA